MKFCVRCGAQLEDDAKFCMTCGAQQPYTSQAQQAYTSAQGGSTYSPGAQPGAPVPPPQKGKSRRILVRVLSIVIGLIIFVLGYALIEKIRDDAAERAKEQEMEEIRANAETLVQSNLDVLFRGIYDTEFLKTADLDEAGAEEIFLNNIDTQLEFFASYIDIEYLPDDLRAELSDVFKEIYSRSKYEVGTATYDGLLTCTVELTVYPMDIITRLTDAIDAGEMNWFGEKYANVSTDDMDEETYQAFDRDWADGIIALLRELLPESGYEEPQVLEVKVVKQSTDGEERWTVSDSSLSEIDACILTYEDMDS